jgi:hypothetical protein
MISGNHRSKCTSPKISPLRAALHINPYVSLTLIDPSENLAVFPMTDHAPTIVMKRIIFIHILIG